jgi:hypothetical protein
MSSKLFQKLSKLINDRFDRLQEALIKNTRTEASVPKGKVVS